MNRKQRRYLERQGKQVPKEPVYNIKSNHIKEITDKVTQDATENAIVYISVLTIYVLNSKFGIGKKRLNRFMTEYINQLECVQDEYVTLEDMYDYIEEMTGIEIRKTMTGVTVKQKFKG